MKNNMLLFPEKAHIRSVTCKAKLFKSGFGATIFFCGSGSGQNVMAPGAPALATAVYFSISLKEVYSVLRILAAYNVLRSIGTFFAVL